MIKNVAMVLALGGVGALGWFGWTGAFDAPTDELAVDASTGPGPAAVDPVAAEALCEVDGRYRRRVYVNITYESPDPSWAAAVAQRALMHREGEVTYVNAGDPRQASSLNGKLDVGQDLSWASQLDVGRVTNVSNSESPVQPELDAACDRLAALDRAETVAMNALADGADRQGVAVMLELQRNEVNNLRSRIRSLLTESDRAQITLYFNPPQG